MPDYKIHGDNIVECERTLDLIAQALCVPETEQSLPEGSPLTPTFTITTPLSPSPFRFTFLPGYGRWDKDILEIIRQRGGCLREATDAIICKVHGDQEVPVLALEYCGALPAGNQAWQRNGRALSFAHASLPYMYIAELSGYELDAQRRRRAPRMPNPAVPFSYLLLTHLTKSPTLPVFVPSPGASEDAIREHTQFYGIQDLIEILRGMLLEKLPEGAIEKLETKVLALVQKLSDSRRRRDTISSESWAEAFTAIKEGQSLASFLLASGPMPWSKTAYISDLTETASTMMSLTANFAQGLTSTSLPLCLVAEENRKGYLEALHDLYPSASASFLGWCGRPGHLAVCWVMGFKPRGTIGNQRYDWEPEVAVTIVLVPNLRIGNEMSLQPGRIAC